MLNVRHLQRRIVFFVKRRVTLTLFALPYAIIFVPVGDFKDYLSFQTASKKILLHIFVQKIGDARI